MKEHMSEALMPQPRPIAIDPPAGTLTLLREWQSVCDAIAAGQTQLLIRKGGIAEGRAGFELKKSFFGLLPTLFHQVKNAAPEAESPEPPTTISLICQLVDAFVVPSLTDLAPLAGLHSYGMEQLAARQNYKTERPLHLLIVRPFRLKAPIKLPAGSLKASCKSWVDVLLEKPMGGIEPVTDVVATERTIDSLRQAIQPLPDARHLDD
jgi:hypothetical protein